MFILANQQTLDDDELYTDAGNHNDHTPILMYSFYRDVSGDSLQILIKAPPGISKFERLYISLYVFSSFYLSFQERKKR